LEEDVPFSTSVFPFTVELDIWENTSLCTDLCDGVEILGKNFKIRGKGDEFITFACAMNEAKTNLTFSISESRRGLIYNLNQAYFEIQFLPCLVNAHIERLAFKNGRNLVFESEQSFKALLYRPG